LSQRHIALSLARGEVRDGVAAIEHFLQVLASRRVGSKVLARAVPEMAAGCAPLAAALDGLADALAGEIAADPEGVTALRGLLEHAASRVVDLAAGLSETRGSSMEARQRLALEGKVRRIAGELGAVVRLLELIGGPVTSETITIDFADALQARRAAARKGVSTVSAAVEIRAGELAVGDVRVVMGLLEQAVLIVARATGAAPRIVVDRGADGFPTFAVDGARPGNGADAGRLRFEAVAHEELPHELGITRAIAVHAGISLVIVEGGRAVTVAL
jgi:hypothetical protein